MSSGRLSTGPGISYYTNLRPKEYKPAGFLDKTAGLIGNSTVRVSDSPLVSQDDRRIQNKTA
jgi:hypothetical protein